MKTFYSHGKLLLTGEYIVLDGAKALAIPTKYGQSLNIKTIDEPGLKWKSINDKGKVWFENTFILDKNSISLHSNCNADAISNRLLQILNAVLVLNPSYLKSTLTKNKGILATSKLEFPQNWGLGSSSTLLNNIAKWANIDAFTLSKLTFGGSGYDIACAQNATAITYSLSKNKQSVIPIVFNPVFKSQLFFVHLNKKQDSRDAIKTYEKNKNNTNTILDQINEITTTLIKTNTLKSFENLLLKHEAIIGKLTNQIPIKERLFKDYKNAIKSLGGWGGDFILVTGHKDYIHSYFKQKGYQTIISFEDMIL